MAKAEVERLKTSSPGSCRSYLLDAYRMYESAQLARRTQLQIAVDNLRRRLAAKQLSRRFRLLEAPECAIRQTGCESCAKSRRERDLREKHCFGNANVGDSRLHGLDGTKLCKRGPQVMKKERQKVQQAQSIRAKEDAEITCHNHSYET
jgi:hypothetical protein